MNGEQRLGLYVAQAQNDLNRRILHMAKGTVSLDAAQMIYLTLGVYLIGIVLR